MADHGFKFFSCDGYGRRTYLTFAEAEKCARRSGNKQRKVWGAATERGEYTLLAEISLRDALGRRWTDLTGAGGTVV